MDRTGKTSPQEHLDTLKDSAIALRELAPMLRPGADYEKLCRAADALDATRELLIGLQRQITYLDSMVKNHRHRVGEDSFAYTPKPEF